MAHRLIIVLAHNRRAQLPVTLQRLLHSPYIEQAVKGASQLNLTSLPAWTACLPSKCVYGERRFRNPAQSRALVSCSLITDIERKHTSLNSGRTSLTAGGRNASGDHAGGVGEEASEEFTTS